MEDKASFTISRNSNLVLAKQPDYIGVSKTDWTRLKRKIKCCKSKTDWWMNVGFTLFGIAGSAFLSLLTLPIDSNSTWVSPTLICIIISSLMIGVLCVFADYREKSFSASNIIDVNDIVTEIENSLVRLEANNTDVEE